MKKLISSLNTDNQKFKLSIFYILNLLDLVFTQFFLFNAPSLYKEANSFLEPIITSHQGLILKIFLPIILVFYWMFRYKNATEKQMKRCNIVLNIFILAYFAILLLHIFNLSVYCFLT